jgi:hypothetical protein
MNTKKSDLQNGNKRIRKLMMKINGLLNGSRSKLKTTMSSLIQDFSIKTMILIKRPNLNTSPGEADTIGQRKLITDLKPGTKGRPLNGWHLNERDAIQKKTTMQSLMMYILRSVTIERETMLSTNVSTEANGHRQIRLDRSGPRSTIVGVNAIPLGNRECHLTMEL